MSGVGGQLRLGFAAGGHQTVDPFGIALVRIFHDLEEFPSVSTGPRHSQSSRLKVSGLAPSRLT
jgi:hypothetical protein